MICERTYDKDIVLGIMLRDDIWATVAEDGIEKSDYAVDFDRECWLIMRSDSGDIVGAFSFKVMNGTTLQIHAQVLPECRKDYAKDCGLAALKWFLSSAPICYQKLVAEIPIIYQNVISFTESFGFIREGTNRLSYSKGGIIVNQILLGITRSEVQESLNGQRD